MVLPPSVKIRQIYAVLSKLVGDGYLNEWEREFVVSNLDRSDSAFTSKQIEIVEKLYLKACDSPY